MNLYQQKEWLERQFSIPGITIAQVAQKANCHEKTIRRWQKRLGIFSRPMAENAWLRQANHLDLPRQTTEIIEGELLGDGSLSSRSKWSARYQHTSASKEYLFWLAGQFYEMTCRIGKNKVLFSKNNGPYESWHLNSLSYTVLKPLYDRFYPNGKKQIPRDLILTPKKCLHWFLGDGGLTDYSRSYKPLVGMSTHGFHVEDLRFIILQLQDFSPRISHCAKNLKMGDGFGHKIILELNFLDYIGPCPLAVKKTYGHKWYNP